jgi:hypothetical protein
MDVTPAPGESDSWGVALEHFVAQQPRLEITWDDDGWNHGMMETKMDTPHLLSDQKHIRSSPLAAPRPAPARTEKRKYDFFMTFPIGTRS